MPRVRFHEIIQGFVGKLGHYIFRRAHNGEISVYEDPFFFKGLKIKWSQPQKDHRREFGDASHYASAAVADPEIRAVYVQMAIEQNKNPKRPSDIASSDYYHNGPDLLWKKHMGDQPKPANWQMDRYPWYFNSKPKRQKKKSKRRW